MKSRRRVNSTVMRVLTSPPLKRFRDIVQWPTLALAIAFFALDWWSRVHYVAFINNAYVDSTPEIVNQIWLLLLFATFVLGIVSIPRISSFLSKRRLYA